MNDVFGRYFWCSIHDPLEQKDRLILTDLRRIIRAVNLEGKRIQKVHGISIPQYLCLSHLNDLAEFSCSIKELSEVLQLNPSTMTGIIKRLERDGHVARLPKRDDRRKTLIVLTQSGAQVVRNNPKVLHEKLMDRLKNLNDDDYQDLRMAFMRITQFLDIESIEAAPIIASETNFPSSDFSSEQQ